MPESELFFKANSEYLSALVLLLSPDTSLSSIFCSNEGTQKVSKQNDVSDLLFIIHDIDCVIEQNFQKNSSDQKKMVNDVTYQTGALRMDLDMYLSRDNIVRCIGVVYNIGMEFAEMRIEYPTVD